jgi:hypothetical protein
VWGVEVQFHVTLTSVLHEGKWSVSRPLRLLYWRIFVVYKAVKRQLQMPVCKIDIIFTKQVPHVPDSSLVHPDFRQSSGHTSLYSGLLRSYITSAGDIKSLKKPKNTSKSQTLCPLQNWLSLIYSSWGTEMCATHVFKMRSWSICIPQLPWCSFTAETDQLLPNYSHYTYQQTRVRFCYIFTVQENVWTYICSV